MDNLDGLIPNLKPCPFCGGDVEISNESPGPFYDITSYIRCRNCDIALCTAWDWGNEKDLIKIWNKRTEENQ